MNEFQTTVLTRALDARMQFCRNQLTKLEGYKRRTKYVEGQLTFYSTELACLRSLCDCLLVGP